MRGPSGCRSLRRSTQLLSWSWVYWVKLSFDITRTPRFEMSGVTLGWEKSSVHDDGLDVETVKITR